MRGSISNDGFSEAFTQEEEDRPQAGQVLGVGGELVAISWYLLHLTSFRTMSRCERKEVQPRAGWRLSDHEKVQMDEW